MYECFLCINILPQVADLAGAMDSFPSGFNHVKILCTDP